ncbi:MAG: hypothetical protein NVSMB51_04730 [Solirubrobacteraceae bacterium]
MRLWIARGGLMALLLGGLTIAVGAAGSDLLVDTAAADEPTWLSGPLSVFGFALSDSGFSFAVLLMAAGYAAAVLCGRHLGLRPALACAGLLILAFTLTSPILSSDLFGYVGYARLAVLHGVNPYLHGVDAAPADPLYHFIFWRHERSPYGPLFTVATLSLGARSLPFAVWTLKLAGGLATLGSLALLAACCRRLGAPAARSVILVGANPLLLLFAVGGGHNDQFVLLLTAAALLFLVRSEPFRGGAALAAAAAVKATGLIVLPFVLLDRRRPDRAALVRGAALAGALLLALTLGVFGPHPPATIARILTRSEFDVAYTGPDLLGRLLGTGISVGVRLLAGAAVLSASIYCAARVARGSMSWLDGAAWTTLAILCGLASFVPWYVLWLLPLSALSRSRGLRGATLTLTALVLATHLPLFGFPQSQ